MRPPASPSPAPQPPPRGRAGAESGEKTRRGAPGPAPRLETTAGTSPREAVRARASLLAGFLDEDSPRVLRVIREELEELGRRARPALERATASESPRVRTRARELVRELDWREAWRHLVRAATTCASRELEAQLFRLGRLERPDLDARPYRRALDAMGREVAVRAARASDPLGAVSALTDYLGNELGFLGSEVGYDHPDNVHLHRALERKRGMPLTLTAIYLFVARRAGLRAAPVALPGHVLLRLYAGRRALLIDPFLGGRLRTRADCVQYLARHNLVPRPEWFRDASDAELFQRHVRNLMNSMQLRGLTRRARALATLAGTLARSAASGSRETRGA